MILLNLEMLLGLRLFAGVSDQGPLSIPVRIGEDGAALIPLLGTIPLAGMQIEQAEQVIRQQAITRGIYRNPHVTVVMETKGANKVTVIGAVEKPGTYDLPRSASNLLTAFVAAGGLSSDASTNIEVRSPARQDYRSNPQRENRLAAFDEQNDVVVAPVSP